MTTLKTLTCQKRLFDIPPHVTYLNAAYISPIMTESAKIGKKAVATKMHPWEITINDFIDLPKKACAIMSKMIGAEEHDVALIPSASYGIGIAALNLPLKRGQKILLLSEQFPSNVYPWQVMAKACGAEIITIARPKNGDWTTALCNAIDQDTAIVACGQVHWIYGSKLDLVKVGKTVRAMGAALVLDLTQSLGVMPFSVRDVDPDFMVAAGYKWLLGPYSHGYIYVAPRHQNGIPLEENWFARKGSEDFSGLVDYQPDYEPGAGRFNVGERSNFMLNPIAIHGLEQLNSWGADAIEAYVSKLTEKIAENAKDLGLIVADKAYRSSHLIGLEFRQTMPKELATVLAKKKIFVSMRGNTMRVSSHIYNDEHDVDNLFSVLKELL
ncbi:MAG: aminotransferase class V-fold PLP-dependent enzyme [Emcibacter sp.]|nr:aminotransferase class V-fold PLP-dependent enzyme [Emcibacter sp.]